MHLKLEKKKAFNLAPENLMKDIKYFQQTDVLKTIQTGMKMIVMKKMTKTMDAMTKMMKITAMELFLEHVQVTTKKTMMKKIMMKKTP